MNKRFNDPGFFETAICSCGSREDLLKHRYNDEIRCSECVNKMIEEIEIEVEHYYTDSSYNELMQERNA